MEQPQPLPAPMAALWSGHLCDHLSRGSARAHPLPQGPQGWWLGQSWGCPGALAVQGPCTAAAWAVHVCQQRVMHRAATAQRVPGLCRPWPRRKWNSPHTLPWCWVNSQPGVHPAPYGSGMAAILSSYSHMAQALLGDHWRTSGGSTGMCQGLLWKPWVLSWRGEEQRGVQPPVPHPTTVLTAPSHIFTPCPGTGPIQR